MHTEPTQSGTAAAAVLVPVSHMRGGAPASGNATQTKQRPTTELHKFIPFKNTSVPVEWPSTITPDAFRKQIKIFCSENPAGNTLPYF